VHRVIICIVFSLLVCACSQTAGTVPPPGSVGQPGSSGGPTPHASATPSPSPTPFNAAAVHIAERPVPVTPLYVAAAADGDAYFGFGANGTGSNLYQLSSTALQQTLPAPPPSGDTPGGGVYGITVTPSGTVFWLSSYFESSFAFAVEVECGGSGGTATICEPTVDEPTSMLVDATGTFWVAGFSFNGGGEIATSSNASANFDTRSVIQIVNGPAQHVWGITADFSESGARYSIVQFGISGQSVTVVQAYALPPGDSATSVTFGGDGDLWFTDVQRNAIGRMDSAGALQEFPLRSPNALPAAQFGEAQIATGCDGAVWFTEPGRNQVARIDAAGVLNEFTLPTTQSAPGAIAAVAPQSHQCTGPELWVGEEAARQLAAVSF
jgi:streptogramin lyase